MQQGRVPSKQLACSATALYLLVATLAAWCVLSIDSWPWNHDYVSTFQRVEVFRLAYLAGDFFPIWTPFGQNGYGSPFPFFYHRLYNSVVGLIALVCSTVTAVRISIPLMLLIGGLGMFRLAKRVGISTPLALASGVLLILANYTYTNWLVRGAMAETLAAMLVPWALNCCVQIIQREISAWWKSCIVLTLLFYAHVMIFYFTLLPFVLALCIALATTRTQRTLVFKGFIAASLVLALSVGIYGTTLVMLKSDFQLERAQKVELLPVNNIKAPKRYLIDQRFRWGKRWRPYSVEIGRGFVLPLILCVLGIAIATPFSKHLRQLLAEQRLILGSFGIILFGFMALQLRSMAWIYQLLPAANFIQFPWRLLSFITPCCILLFCIVLHISHKILENSRWRCCTWLILISALIYQCLFAVRASTLGYRHILSEDLAHAVSPEGLNQGLYFGYEYLPANMAKPPQPTPFIDITACELTPGSIAGLPQRQHFTRLDFDLEALTPCTIHISQFYSALLAVSSSSGDVNISAQGTVSVDLATGVNIITIETKSIYELVL